MLKLATYVIILTMENKENKLEEEKENIHNFENANQENSQANLDETENVNEKSQAKEEVKLSRKAQILEFIKFLAFSLSAGVIQLGSFELLYHIIKWDMWWPCYLISIVLSVIWNFTFNRKFTFKSASNLPLAMSFAFLFYCAFIPVSVFGGNALEGIGWHGTLVTVLMMVINFVTEYVWDKFVVFNDKLMNKIAGKLHLKKKKD